MLGYNCFKFFQAFLNEKWPNNDGLDQYWKNDGSVLKKLYEYYKPLKGKDGDVDGEKFAGGQSEDYGLEIGSGSFIPGFEEQIIGKSVGDEFDVNVTFPSEYAKEQWKKSQKQ